MKKCPFGRRQTQIDKIRKWAELPCPNCKTVLIRGMPAGFCCQKFEALIAGNLPLLPRANPREVAHDRLQDKKAHDLCHGVHKVAEDDNERRMKRAPSPNGRVRQHWWVAGPHCFATHWHDLCSSGGTHQPRKHRTSTWQTGPPMSSLNLSYSPGLFLHPNVTRRRCQIRNNRQPMMTPGGAAARIDQEQSPFGDASRVGPCQPLWPRV
jgi:hypothetical protein